MLEGRIVLSGGPGSWADRLEETGYEGIQAQV